MNIRCPSCGRYTTTTPTGGVRLHPRQDAPAEKCRGWPLALKELGPQPESICVVLTLRSGRVFRCDVPLGLADDERAEIAQAMETLHTAMQRAISKRATRGIPLPSPPVERSDV